MRTDRVAQGISPAIYTSLHAVYSIETNDRIKNHINRLGQMIPDYGEEPELHEGYAYMLEHGKWEVEEEKKNKKWYHEQELAVNGECQYIVTYNIKDFEQAELFGIEVIKPHDFLKMIGVKL